MAEEWFFSQNGQQMGPVEFGQLQQIAMNRQLQPSDLVWKQGMPNWAPAQTIPGIFQVAAPPPPPPPPQQPVYPQTPLPQPPGGYAQPGYGGQPNYPQQPGTLGYQPQYVQADMGVYYRKARTSMILALVGLLLFGFGIITGILAIVYASQAMSGMSRTGDQRGKGMAITGLVIGIIDILAWCGYLSVYRIH